MQAEKEEVHHSEETNEDDAKERSAAAVASSQPLMQMFVPPPPPSSQTKQPAKVHMTFEREATTRIKNSNRKSNDDDDESSPLLQSLFQPPPSSSSRNGHMRSLSEDDQASIDFTAKESLTPLNDLFAKPNSNAKSAFISDNDNDEDDDEQQRRKNKQTLLGKLRQSKYCCSPQDILTTIIGSFTFLLYSIVFCLALSSGIHRPSSPFKQRLLGPIAKCGAIGVMATSPALIYFLGDNIPALYPCLDLFLAPFFSQLAIIVDDTLSQQNLQERDDIFLSTFIFLNSIGMLLCAVLNICASKFKFANLAGYLPYSVMAGFFSTVGLSLWSLAFQVDTNGKTLHSVLFHHNDDDSEFGEEIKHILLHHLPSLFVGFIMFAYGPKHPLMVPLLVALTVVGTYIAMWAFGLTIEDARNDHWFWLAKDLIYDGDDIGLPSSMTSFSSLWLPPTPFGVIGALFHGKVHFRAVLNGLPTACAMSVVYTLRCSLHAPALKKNAGRLVASASAATDSASSSFRNNTNDSTEETPRMNTTTSRKDIVVSSSSFASISPIKMKAASRRVSSANNSIFFHNARKSITVPIMKPDPKGKKTEVQMTQLIFYYGIGLAVGGFVGGFAALPAIAAGATLFNLGADGVAPQYGSNILLLIFYLTDFKLISCVPKPAFSCLLIVAFFDLMYSWFYQSYKKTKNKLEWSVVPLIMIFSYVVGILESIALGVAAATFIFVPSLFKSGIVKFNSNGQSLRSTIERSNRDALWLDQNGDLMQVLVLQNFLFFGNASSLSNYISTMFEDSPITNNTAIKYYIPPKPKYVIIDMTIVTGMDTSAVDVFAEISSLCEANTCTVFFAGLTQKLQSTLLFGGVRPSSSGSYRYVRFLPDLETALGKAEDGLLENVLNIKEKDIKKADIRRRERLMSDADDGFLHALLQIDEQVRELCMKRKKEFLTCVCKSLKCMCVYIYIFA